jgi:hypothetical protein
MPTDVNPEDVDPSDLAKKLKIVAEKMQDEYDFDPT